MIYMIKYQIFHLNFIHQDLLLRLFSNKRMWIYFGLISIAIYGMIFAHSQLNSNRLKSIPNPIIPYCSYPTNVPQSKILRVLIINSIIG